MSEFMKWLRSAPVVWKPLGEVLVFQRGTSITRKTSKEGEYPVISGGQQPAYYVDQYNRTGETITIAGSGAYAGFVMYWNEPIFVGDAFSIKSEDNKVLVRYVFHFLLNIQEQIYALKRGGGVPHVYAKDLSTFEIPIPPMEVQEEIVRILDKFTELIAALNKELELRRKQYDYYLHHLLTSDPSEVTYKPLEEVFEMRNGYTPSKANEEFWTDGTIPWFRMEDLRTNGRVLSDSIQHITPKAIKGKGLFKAGSIIMATTATIGERALLIADSLANQRFTNFSVRKSLTESLLPKFVYYYFYIIDEWCKRNVNTSSFPSVDMKLLKQVSFPIPPLSEQERIVGILDKFERLTNSLTEGLPREIELRQKQYEYYRNLLLSFE